MINRYFLAIFLLSLAGFCNDSLKGFDDYVPMDIVEEEVIPLDPNLPNLDDGAQDFVLETKQIRFKEFPQAFNPSIIRWKGRLLLVFRTYHPKTRATDEIGICHLDENFDPVDAPQLIKFKSSDPYCLFKRQDPRLIAVGERLYIVYNNVINDEVRRMVVAELLHDGKNYSVDSSECFLHFDGEVPSRSEKNWAPFEYEGQLYLIYSLFPHRILRPLFETSRCESIATSFSSIKWNWGVLRGGTPAMKEGDEYISFFHSCKSMTTQHSKGKSIPHYFMGAYTFSPKPPFAITRISARPIFAKNFYNGKAYKTWKPVCVVFPAGFISDEKYFWVLYGRQDHEIWVAKLDKEGLYKSLVSVEEK